MTTNNNTATRGWNPAAGDSITGRIQDIAEHDAGYGLYPILELVTDSGTVAVHAFHDVLKRELARLAPDIGDTLTIGYGGKHPDKGYHQYKVRDGDGRGRGVDWSQYGDIKSPEAPPSDVPSDFPGYGQSATTPAPADADPKGTGDVDDVPF